MYSNKFKKLLQYESSRLDFFIRKIDEAKVEVSHSEFYTLLISQLEQCCKLIDSSTVKCIVCYGLGNFSKCVTARYQLSLLLLLRDKINVEVLLFDPVFEDIEIDLINKLQLTLFKNDEAFRKINIPTLVILPHCSVMLTNNLLWANWNNKLRNMILLCNSFNKIRECKLPNEFANLYYIHSIFPYIQELPISNCFSNTMIFNDLSFHVLPNSKFNDINAKNIWKYRVKPKYPEVDYIH